MNRIITFEHTKIKYSDIFGKNYNVNSREFKKFIENIEQKYKENLKLGYDYISIKNFVGVIKVNDCIIEVLPKMFANSIKDFDKTVVYNNFYYMLNKANRIKYNNISTETFNSIHVSVLDYYINIFLEELNNKLRNNLYHAYECKVENRKSIKGKILVSHNIKTNLYNRSKIVCQYDEFTENNLVNQILKFTVKKMMKVTRWSKNKKLSKILLNKMSEIDDIVVTNESFTNIKHDNNLYYLEKILSTAKMFINNLFTSFKNANKQDIFVFSFDMNFLFQEYIYSLVYDNKHFIFGKNVNVLRQLGKKYLIYDNGIGKLKLIPDIIIEEDNNVKYLIDTKYKILDESKLRFGIEPNDIYQMNAYIDKFNPQIAILLYPEVVKKYSQKYSLEKEGKNKILGCTVNLKLNLIEDEKKLIEEIKEIIHSQ